MSPDGKLMFIRSVFLITFLFCVYCVNTSAQDVCISQQAANQCAANTRELVAANEKIAVLEAALREKDKTIDELKEANRKNVADITGQLNKVTADWAFEKGRVEQCHADKVLWSAIIPVLVQNTRQKTNGIKIF